jgi:glycerol uptake facilitator protein
VEERGPASYLAEFLGTLFLVFFVTMAVSLFVTQASAQNPAPFIDWSVIGLVHVFVLFVLVQTLAVVSGAHFNPAVTVGMTLLRQIRPSDAGIYILAQLAGGVAGALLTKLILNDFPNADAVNFGATTLSDRIAGKTGIGMLCEFIGTFILVMTIIGVAVDPRIDRALAPLAIGVALGLAVMIFGSLTGGSFNPARSFGPAIVSGEWGGAGKWLLCYVLAPVLGALAAASAYTALFSTPGAKPADGLEPVG